MTSQGWWAVLVDSPLDRWTVTAGDVIEAVRQRCRSRPCLGRRGGTSRARPAASCEQHPTTLREEMAASRLEIVAVVDGDAPMALASSLCSRVGRAQGDERASRMSVAIVGLWARPDGICIRQSLKR